MVGFCNVVKALRDARLALVFVGRLGGRQRVQVGVGAVAAEEWRRQVGCFMRQGQGVGSKCRKLFLRQALRVLWRLR